jgi:K+-transporting ATPase c subunit
VLRLIVAVVVGVVIAVGATVVTVNLLSDSANGSPSNASLYQYGSR